jgi:hypothetical protein
MNRSTQTIDRTRTYQATGSIYTKPLTITVARTTWKDYVSAILSKILGYHPF